MNCDEAAELIEAYADDELVPATREAVAAHVVTCRACKQALADVGDLRASLRSAGHESLSSDFESKVRSSLAEAALRTRARPRRLAFYGVLAACQALLLVGAGGVGAWLSARGAAQTFGVQEAVSAHVRLLGDDHAIQVASSDQHTVKPWFADKLDFSPAVIDLGPEGFPLLGGRRDYVAGHPVAALLYSRHLHKITVFVAADRNTEAMPAAVASRDGVNVISWRQGGLTYEAISDLNGAELADFSRKFQAASPAAQ